MVEVVVVMVVNGSGKTAGKVVAVVEAVVVEVVLVFDERGGGSHAWWQ